MCRKNNSYFIKFSNLHKGLQFSLKVSKFKIVSKIKILSRSNRHIILMTGILMQKKKEKKQQQKNVGFAGRLPQRVK